MTYCHVSNQIDSYIAAQDQEERDADAIEARAQDLLREGADFWPYAPGNFAEALGNTPDQERLAAAVSGVLADKSGALIFLRDIVWDYWHDRAREAAREAVAQEGWL